MTMLLVALAVAGAPTSDPSATVARHDRADCPRRLERTYSRAYRHVARVHGARAPGRNIRRYGVRFEWHGKVAGVFDATCGELRRSRRQLKQLLEAPPVMYSTAVPPPQPPAAVRSDFDIAALPSCTWAPESGGDYNAYNPSSGAYGKYQIIPSTWAAHCSDLGSDAAGQEQCAARVWSAQGAGAWVGC